MPSRLMHQRCEPVRPRSPSPERAVLSGGAHESRKPLCAKANQSAAGGPGVGFMHQARTLHFGTRTPTRPRAIDLPLWGNRCSSSLPPQVIAPCSMHQAGTASKPLPGGEGLGWGSCIKRGRSASARARRLGHVPSTGRFERSVLFATVHSAQPPPQPLASATPPWLALTPWSPQRPRPGPPHP